MLGGAFALACLLSAPGNLRDVLFQVAFGGYVGALFNLNPLLERDGYHVLVDLLREPGLRRRASQRLNDVLGRSRVRLAGADRLLVYGLASLCWSALTVAFAVVLSLRYYDQLVALAPAGAGVDAAGGVLPGAGAAAGGAAAAAAVEPALGGTDRVALNDWWRLRATPGEIARGRARSDTHIEPKR